MASFIDVHCITGMQPAADKGRRRFLRIFQVTTKHTVTSDKQLAFTSHSNFGPEGGATDTFESDFTGSMAGDQSGFGTSVVLPELDTDSMDKAKRVQCQNRTTGHSKTDMAQSKLIFKRPEEEIISYRM